MYDIEYDKHDANLLWIVSIKNISIKREKNWFWLFRYN